MSAISDFKKIPMAKNGEGEFAFGAIHKGRPHPRGEGGSVKSGHMRTQGEGGSVAKSGRPQIQIFTKILEVKMVSCVLKNNI